MSPRLGRAALLSTLPVALSVCFPWHLTRFWPPKLAVAFVCVALGLAALRPVPTRRSGLPPSVVWGWLVILGWGALSLTWSPDPQGGLNRWLLWLLSGLWAVLLGRAVFREPAEGAQRLRRTLAWTWLGAGVAAALLALIQRGGWLRLGLYQVTSTLGNPNRVAVVLVLCVPLAILLWHRARGDSGRRVAGSAALLLGVGVVATGCRAAILALAVQAAALVLTSARTWRFRAACLSLLLVVTALFAGSRPVPAAASRSVTGRVYIARVSTRVLAQRPVLGTGLGGYGARAAGAQAALLAENPRLRSRWSLLEDAHNEVLMMGAELGLVGLAALLLLLVGGIRVLIRRRDTWSRHALVAWLGLGVCSLTETVSASPVVVLLASGWLVLGAAPAESRVGAALVLPRWATRVAVPGLAALGVVLSLGILAAHWQLGRGLRRLGTGTTSQAELQAAARDYGRGLRVWGATGQLRFQRALVRVQLGDLRGAESDALDSFRRRPSPDRALLLGDLRLARHDAPGALRWYRRALRYHPQYQRAYNNLGVALLRGGRPAEGCRHLRRACSLRPGDAVARHNVKLYCGRGRLARRDL